MDLHEVLILTVTALILWILFQKYRLYKKMAPGPYGLPVVGSMLHLARNNAIDEFQKYKKKYGKVFSVSVGEFYITVVCDHKLVIDSLKKDVFQGKPNFELMKIRNNGNRNRGILFSDGGPVWHEQRRFALRSLRDFGFGKESMEGMLLQDLQELQNELRKNLGHPISLSGVFNASVLNSLWYIITGNRFELNDPTLKTLITLLIDSIRNAALTSPGFFFFTPVKWGVIGKGQLSKTLEFLDKIKAILSEVVESHRSTYKDGEIRDFIDAYLAQIKESPPDSSFYGDEGKMHLYTVLLDLFVAGAETTSTTLQWAILYICHHPHVQKKVQEEIDNVLGKSKPPNRADKSRLIYLEAVLNEVHRMASLVPYNSYHTALQDSEIGGYFIPKNSIVFFGIYDLHHDKDIWGDPEKFRPERHLDASGTKVVKHEALIPFSSGKRQCLGETLARDTLFLFLTGLLQQFSFEIDPACSNSEMKGSPSGVSSPNKFRVILKERK